MWCSVLALTLAVCGCVEVRADAEPSPFFTLPLSWAAQAFGTPEEIAAQTQILQRHEIQKPAEGTFKPSQAPPSPLFAIRDVKAPPKHIAAIRTPAVRPYQSLWMVAPPLFVHTMHLRTPATPYQRDPTPSPMSAPTDPVFAQRHTAQIPLILPSVPVFPTYLPTRRHTQSPPSFHDCDDDDDDDDDRPNLVYVRHFPTEIASPMTLRDATDDGPLAPAGIVQSTQPIIEMVEFTNAKAHPSLLGTRPAKDSGVIAI